VVMAPSRTGPKKPRKRPQVERALSALSQVYPPDGKPPDGMSGTLVLKAVNKELERQGKKPVSPDSLARALGRR
jgi:hypothetical protein